MIDFIHISGDSLGKDADTKKRVRIQAMRNYRERQRTSRSRCQSILPSLNHTFHAVGNQGLVQPAGQERADSATSVSASHEHSQPCRRKRAVTRGNRDFKRSQESLRVIARLHRRDSEHAYMVPACPIHMMTASVDPFDSPLYVNQMLGLCRSWVTWLLPTGYGDRASQVLYSAWEITPSPFMLAPSLLASIGYTEAIDPTRPRSNDSLIKARLLREVNKRMRYDLTATSDAMVSALLLLTSFELVRLNRESILHLKGLKKIVELKGGKSQLGPDGAQPSLTMMLELLDMLQKIVFSSELIFLNEVSFHQTADDHTCLSEIHRELRSNLVADLRTSEKGSTTRISNKLRCDLEALLSSATECINCLSTHARRSEKAAQTFFGQLSLFNDEHCGNILTGSNSSIQLARACHQSMAIVYNLVVNQHPIGDPSNESYADGLFRAMQSIDDEIWSNIAYFQVWLLFIGLVVSTETCRRSFFQAHLIRKIYTTGAERWTDMKCKVCITSCHEVGCANNGQAFIVKCICFIDQIERSIGIDTLSPSQSESFGDWDSTLSTARKLGSVAKGFSMAPQTTKTMLQISSINSRLISVPLDRYSAVDQTETSLRNSEDSDIAAAEMLESDRQFLVTSFTGGYWFTVKAD